MKIQIFLAAFLLFSVNVIFAGEPKDLKKVYGKKDILKLSDAYVNNNFNIQNPAIVDVDGDGNFDMLSFNDDGKVEYYRNTGTLESPVFVLENKNYDDYEISSFISKGLPMPVFLADKDGDKDMDMFAIVSENNKHDVMYVENTMGLDNYTLITIILVLLIVALLVIIVK